MTAHDPLNRNGVPDPIRDAPGMAEHADSERIFTQMREEFESFRETLIYKTLCNMAAADEDAAIEKLIEGTDTDEQRAIIARCRYFQNWAFDMIESIEQARTEHDPVP